jgi:TonB family protein
MIEFDSACTGLRNWTCIVKLKGLGAGLMLVCALETASAQQLASPAVFRDGPLPAVPFDSMAIGGGQVFLELTVTDRGAVSLVRPLRVTRSFEGSLVDAARSWQFDPAEELVDPALRKPGERDTRPVESKVLVAAVYRPPTINAPTLGEPVQDVAAASLETPFPLSTTIPPFPATAYNPGLVMIELRLDPNGSVVGVRTVRSSPPFDGAALDAAQKWTFDPARFRGIRSTSLVYVIFAFPRPVV